MKDTEPLQQKIYDENAQQLKLDQIAAQNAYTSNIGGANYRNYGSQMRNGSTYSSSDQYSLKKQLENIENVDIPNIKKVIENTQKESEAYIDAQNEEIKKLLNIENKTEKDLKEKYDSKEKEIDECENKIREYEASISETKSAIFNSKATIANLEAEKKNLRIDTNDKGVNEQNKARKAEIEALINEENQKIKSNEEKLHSNKEPLGLEILKANAEKSKADKENELAEIQENIKETKPKFKKTITEIQEKIRRKNEETKNIITTLNERLKSFESQAINLQTELGKQAGIVASKTGSEVVQKALELARNELGTREATGRNDGRAVSKYRNGIDNNAPWCASFVSYLYGAGQNSDNGGTFGYQASVNGIRKKAYDAGMYSPKGTYNPIPGDIVIMKSRGASHTAIVEAVGANGEIQTIGGNESNSVCRKVISPGSTQYAKISGYVRMNDWQNKIKQN